MFTIRPFEAPLGAEVIDLDLREPLSQPAFDEIAEAFAKYSVLVLRDQKIDEDQHIAFSRRFGELDVLGFYQRYLHPNHPEIFVVSNVLDAAGIPIGLPDAGRIWHTDVSYRREPSMGSLLLAREVPHDDSGTPLGDTIFTSTAAAYDALSDAMKRELSGRKAIHRLDESRYQKDPRTRKERGKRAELTDAQKALIEDVEHPIVRTHPVTGRKCLYVNELYTFGVVDYPGQQGEALIKELCDHATDVRFQYRHKWRVGDLLLWDNCATQHLAVGDYKLPQRRLMHRTTVRGGIPF